MYLRSFKKQCEHKMINIKKVNKLKKKLNLKIIVSVFVLLLILIGTGTGFFLSQQSQDLRQQARSQYGPSFCGTTFCSFDQVCLRGKCMPEGSTTCGPNVCTPSQKCWYGSCADANYCKNDSNCNSSEVCLRGKCEKNDPQFMKKIRKKISYIA